MLQSANGMDQVTGRFYVHYRVHKSTFWAEQDYSVFAKRIKGL